VKSRVCRFGWQAEQIGADLTSYGKSHQSEDLGLKSKSASNKLEIGKASVLI